MSDAPLPPRLLLTGGTGTLGRQLVDALNQRGAIALRILSRRAQPAQQAQQASAQWAQADLLSDDLGFAVRDVDMIIHLASSKGSSDADAVGTRRLLAAAKAAGVRHFVAISIIGCDRIPLPFYGTKLAIEAAVRAGGVPWSIVRVAQFHSFVERLVAAAATPPIPTPILAELRFQPVDEREVAERLLEIALGPPLADAPDIAGPELLTLAEIAAAWLSFKGSSASLVPVSTATLFGAEPPASAWARPVLEAYERALNTPHGEHTLGRVRFADWLRAH